MLHIIPRRCVAFFSHHSFFVLILRFVLQVFREFFRKDVAANLKKDIKAVVHDVATVGREFVAGPSDSHQEDSAPTNDKPEQDIAPASDDKLQENVAP